jgi:hypothetical protein
MLMTLTTMVNVILQKGRGVSERYCTQVVLGLTCKYFIRRESLHRDRCISLFGLSNCDKVKQYYNITYSDCIHKTLLFATCDRPNKLECTSLAGLSRLLQWVRVRPGASHVD